MTIDVLVVGAGIAGATCAARCTDAGLSVQVVDRGRRVGGRLATRTFREQAPPLPVDTGTASFGLHGDDFTAVVSGWIAGGVAVRVGADLPPRRSPRAIGARGARGLVEHLLSGAPVESDVRIAPLDADGRVDGRPSRAVVLAMPGPQAARLLAALPPLAAVADQAYAPALTLAARFERARWARFSTRAVDAGEELCWVTDVGRARGDDAPVLLARSSAAFAAEHLDDPQAARPALLAGLRRALALRDEAIATHVQRWTYAQPIAGRETTHHLGAELVGLCGDGWSARGGVEGAWRSGRDLADALIPALA